MDRRDFLLATRRKKPTAITIKTSGTGLQPYTGPWTANEAAHLLKRTMFGATKTDIDYFTSLTVGEAVDELLDSSITATPPVRDYELLEDDGIMYDDLGVIRGNTWVNDPNRASAEMIRGAINRARVSSLKKWWCGLMINQQRSIQEKMILFWHHHFSVQESEIENAQFLYRHHALLRANYLGNFKNLMKEVTIDPAMLVHLNGYLNAKQAPDENFARELQELFTIGKDIEPGFTESDVIQAARVLTGWRINSEPLGSYLDVNAHDTGTKTFSAFYNNTSIAGSTNGQQELDALFDMIFSAEEASKYIIRKLYRWFVYYEIDETVETDVIVPLSLILRTNNYEIKPVLDALFKSEHFFDVQNQACFIKTPVDIIVGTLREFAVPYPAYTDYLNGYPLFGKLYEKAAEMQMQLFQPPDVAGWPSFHQEPMHYELWVNSNSLPKRARYTDSLVDEDILDLRQFLNHVSNPADPDLLVLELSTLLLRYPLSDNARTFTKTRFLLNNTSDNSIWTNAWNTNQTGVIDSSLRNLFRFLMNLPEYHLC